MNAKASGLPSSEEKSPASERGSVAYMVGAVALVVIVSILVLVFGVVRPPALPSLDAAGVTPPGSVAWTQWRDREDCTAIMVARADGTVDRLACEEEGGDVIAWTEDGIVTFGWRMTGPQLVTWDPTTGDVVSVETATEDYWASPASSVSSFHRDGTLVVTLDPGARKLWTVDADREYSVRAGTLSPDRAWVAMVDSSERLLVVRASGGDLAVWVDGAVASWASPVWEGTAIPEATRNTKS